MMYGYGSNMMGGSGLWGWGLMGVFFMVIFWVLVIVGIVLLIRWLVDQTGRAGTGTHAQHGSVALDIAKERYARGEISKEQFDEMKKDLM